MKQMLLVTACVCAVASGSAFAQAKYPASRAKPDTANSQQYRLMDSRSFLLSSAQGAFADAELGRLAVSKASSEEVRRFARLMVEAAEKAMGELKPLLKAQEIPAPTEIDPRHRVSRDWLLKLPGEAFDRAYVTAMTAKQTNDVTFLQRAAANTHDPDVRKWAAETLPIVQEHQAMAKGITLGSK